MNKEYHKNKENQINNSLILPSEFNLTTDDIERFAGKFITVEQLKNEGRRRVDDTQGREILNPFNSSDFDRRYKNRSGVAYIYRKFFDSENPTFARQYRVRRDSPEKVEKCGVMKETGKYLSTYGAKNMFYVPHGVKVEWLSDVSIPVVFFEGEDKATAAARVASADFTLEKWHFIPVALAGVWNFRTDLTKVEDGKTIEYKGLIQDFGFFNWSGRKTTVFFDANVHTNPGVKSARRELAVDLENLGAIAHFAELPKKYSDGADGINGFDDFLAFTAKQTSDAAAIEAGLKLINSASLLNEKPKKENQATRILNFADDVELLHTPDGEAFATIETNGHFENHYLRSKAFRSWLAYQFFKAENQMPSTQALQDAINTLEGKALFEGAEVKLFIRLASANGKIYLDSCNDDWQIIEIDGNGRRVIEAKDAPVRFRRTKAMLSLPLPAGSGDISKLKNFLNVDEKNFILILAWLINCFRPDYPFPILVLSGEQGTAKSTATKVCRELVDPSLAPFRSAPRDERDLAISASNAWICAFDNLSSVSNSLSDSWCRLSTGGSLATRTLDSDDDETIFTAKRPIILNGIGDIASNGDLIDRALPIKLETIPKDKRKPEREFWAEFEKEKKSIFSALLTAVSSALKNIENTTFSELPRMADFALWATAAEQSLGLKENDFINAYTQNREDAHSIVLEDSILAEVLQELCAAKAAGGKYEQKDVLLKDFLSQLKEAADAGSKERSKDKKFPKSPKGLRNNLERINPNLREIGIFITFHGRTGGNANKGASLSLEYDCNQTSQTSQTSQSPKNKAQTSDVTCDVTENGEMSNVTKSSNVTNQMSNITSAKHNGNNGLASKSDVSDVSDVDLQTYSIGNDKAKFVDIEI